MKKLMITTLAAATLSVFALTAQAGGSSGGGNGQGSVASYQNSGDIGGYKNVNGFNGYVGSTIQGGAAVDSHLKSSGGYTSSYSSNLAIGGGMSGATTTYSNPGNATATTVGFSGDYQNSTLQTDGKGATGYANAGAGQDYAGAAAVNFSSSKTNWGLNWDADGTNFTKSWGGNNSHHNNW